MAKDGDVSLTFTIEALAVFSSAERLIAEARQWIDFGTWLEETKTDPVSPEAHALMAELRDKVSTMERTWHQGVIGLIKLAGGFGDLHITKDGEFSLYFHERQSGFCGALIYHPAYRDGKRQPYGDWSTHT